MVSAQERIRARIQEREEREASVLALPALNLTDPKALAELGLKAETLYYPAEPTDRHYFETELMKAKLAVFGGVAEYGFDWFEDLSQRLIGASSEEDRCFSLYRFWCYAAAWIEEGKLSEFTPRLETLKACLQEAWRLALPRVKRPDYADSLVTYVAYAKPDNSAGLLTEALVAAKEMLPEKYEDLIAWYPAGPAMESWRTRAETIGSRLKQASAMGKLGELTNMSVGALNLGGEERWKEVRDYLAMALRDLSEEQLAKIDESIMSYVRRSVLATDWSLEEKVGAMEKIVRVAKIVRERELEEIKATKLEIFDSPGKPDGGDEVLGDAIKGLLDLGQIDRARSLYWYWPWCDAREVLQIAGELMKLKRAGVAGIELWLDETKYTFFRLSEKGYDTREETELSWEREAFWTDYGVARRGEGFYLDAYINRIRSGEYWYAVGQILEICQEYPQQSEAVMRAVYVDLLSRINQYQQKKLEVSEIPKLCEILHMLITSQGSSFYNSEFYRLAKEMIESQHGENDGDSTAGPHRELESGDTIEHSF